MNCQQCGKTIAKNQPFCDACGAAPERSHKKPSPITIVLSIALALSLIANIALLIVPGLMTPKKASVRLEGNGFSSPEAAITAYAKALKSGDVDTMLSTYAIESYIDSYDLKDYLNEFLGMTYNSTILLTTDNSNKYVQEVDKYTRVASISQEMREAYCYLLGIDTSRPTNVYYNDEQGINDLVELLAAQGFEKKLSKIKIGDVLTKDDFTFCNDEEYYDQQLKKIMSYTNATELCDVAIEIDFDGNEYYLFMLTGKIQGKWYNLTTRSHLAYYFVLGSNITYTTHGFYER